MTGRKGGGARRPRSAFAFSALLKNPYIRGFLQNFPEQDWNLTVKYACIFGIQCLSKHGPFASMSTATIEALIKSNNASIAFESAIPTLRTRLDELHHDIDNFEHALTERPAVRTTRPGAVAGQTQTGAGPGAGASGPGYPRVVTANKPKPVRRRRQMTIAGKKRTIPAVRHNLTSQYPFVDKRGTVEQALEGGEAVACSVGVQTSREDVDNRSDPRLCYHWPAAAQGGVVADDWATAQYRNVPSSGYGYGYQPGQARDEPVVDDGVWHVPAGYRYKNRHEAVTSGTQTARSRPQTAAPGWQPGYPATSAWQQPTAIPTAGPGVPNGAPVAPGGPWNGANPAVATGGAAPQLFPYFYPHAQLLPYTAYGLTAEQLAAAAQAQAVAATLAAAGKASGATQGGKPGGRRRHATFAPDSGSSSGAAGARSPRKRSKAKSKAKVASQQRVPATSAAPKAAAKAVRSPAPKRHGDAKTSSATRRAMQQDRAAARAAARRRPARPAFMDAVDSAGAPTTDESSDAEAPAPAPARPARKKGSGSAILDIADDFLRGPIMADLEESKDVWERILSDVGFDMDQDDALGAAPGGGDATGDDSADAATAYTGASVVGADGLFDYSKLARASRAQLGYR